MVATAPLFRARCRLPDASSPATGHRILPPSDWVAALGEAGVPCGPINTLDRVFADRHVVARGAAIEMRHALSATGSVALAASPAKLSATPHRYHTAPPTLGEHTAAVLGELLGLDGAALAALRDDGVI